MPASSRTRSSPSSGLVAPAPTFWISWSRPGSRRSAAFDGDLFYPHNAFRAPGALDLTDWGKSKASVAEQRYTNFRHGLSMRQVYVDASSTAELEGGDLRVRLRGQRPCPRRHLRPFDRDGDTLRRRRNGLESQTGSVGGHPARDLFQRRKCRGGSGHEPGRNGG
ncbi:hypothetical protein BQ8482_130134 [Mesorhizobium delmotii]|uniref:Uncharacterized protein n=1 Tax=Mesorhizobium delmotii TaxID=1631247 RepID=A0A2P9AGH8_9HYPH|nr:hypothetical protein BQ8482_130134 [Mesorhizobium delmotii]